MSNDYLDKIFESLPIGLSDYGVYAYKLTVKDGLLIETMISRGRDTLYLLDQERANHRHLNGSFAYYDPYVMGYIVDGEYDDAVSEAEEHDETVDEEKFRKDFTEVGEGVEYSYRKRSFPIDAIAEDCFIYMTKHPLTHFKTDLGDLLRKVLINKPEGYKVIENSAGTYFDEYTKECMQEWGKKLYDEATQKRLEEHIDRDETSIELIERYVREGLLVNADFTYFTYNGGNVFYDLATGEKSGNKSSYAELENKIYERILQCSGMKPVRDAIERGTKWGVSYLPSHNLLFTTLDGEAFAVGPYLYVSPEELVLMLSGYMPHPHSDIFQFMFDFSDITGGDSSRERILNGLLTMNPELKDYDKVFDKLVQTEFERLLADPTVEFVNSGDRPYGLYTGEGKGFIPLAELENNQNVFHLCSVHGRNMQDGTVEYDCKTEFSKGQDGRFNLAYGREECVDKQEDCTKVAPEITTSVFMSGNEICKVLRYEGKNSAGKKSSPYSPVNHGFDGRDTPNAEFDNTSARAGYKTNPVKVAATAAAYFKYRDYLKEQMGLSVS